MLHQCPHRVVIHHDLADHFERADAGAVVDHLLHQQAANAQPLKIIPNDNRELSADIVWVIPNPHHSQHLLTAIIVLMLGNKCHLPVIVDMRQDGEVPLGKVRLVVEVAKTNALFR